MLAINSTSLTGPQEKLCWVFNVFDADGSGTINAEEIRAMLAGLFEMAGAEVEEEELAVACGDVMAAIDGDGDGEVTREEWVRNAMASQYIASLLAEEETEETKEIEEAN